MQNNVFILFRDTYCYDRFLMSLQYKMLDKAKKLKNPEPARAAIQP